MTMLHTARLSLPLLAVGQAQKELFHNEALSLLDFLVQPVALSVEDDPSLLTPLDGQLWLVGISPSGDWIGRANHLAGWTGSGWRYLMPTTHMKIYIEQSQEFATFKNGEWMLSGQVADPDGGTVIDAEARVAIESILTILRSHGLVAI